LAATAIEFDITSAATTPANNVDPRLPAWTAREVMRCPLLAMRVIGNSTDPRRGCTGRATAF
jgi:hypothetical protein